MSSNVLAEEELISALPAVLSGDESLNALASAIAAELQTLSADTALTTIYKNIGTLPESVLDTLAKDFKIDWYDYDYTVDVKRALIKSSFAVHRKLGTKQAMAEALQCVYSNARVEEWFDYGGEPYYFRVVLDAAYTDLSTATDANIINGIITTYKSLRSHMEGAYYRATAELALVCSFGYVLYATRLCGTYPTRSTQGGIDELNIVVQTELGDVTYENCACGVSPCGTIPSTSTQGEIGELNIVAQTELGDVTYENCACGASSCGTHPSAATQGEIDSSGIVASAAGESAAYEAIPCGTSLCGTL